MCGGRDLATTRSFFLWNIHTLAVFTAITHWAKVGDFYTEKSDSPLAEAYITDAETGQGWLVDLPTIELGLRRLVNLKAGQPDFTPVILGSLRNDSTPITEGMADQIVQLGTLGWVKYRS